MGQFTLLRRSQVSAANEDDSQAAVFDLFMGFEDETQARHFTLLGSPFESDRLVGELGAGVSKDKLTFASGSAQLIEPGAAGRKEDGQSVSGDVTQTRIEQIDTGTVEIVSDENDSKIFQFAGQKLTGRFRMNRESDTSRFNIAIEGQQKVDGGSGGAENPPTETDKDDPPLVRVDEFVNQEFDELLRARIEEDANIDPRVEARLRSIRDDLGNNKLTARGVVFALRLITKGEASALEGEEQAEEDAVIMLWDDSDWDGDEITYLDTNTGREYKLVKNERGTFDIPRFEFIREGRFNGQDFGRKLIEKVITNFAAVTKTGFHDVPVKIGHHRNQSLRGDKGELAHGWANEAWGEERDGKLHGYISLTDIPRSLAFMISKRALKNRSAEIFDNFEGPEGKRIGPTLKAIALLGTSTPAVRGLEPAATVSSLDSLVHMFEEEGNNVIIANLRSETPMPDKAPEKKKEVIELSQEEFDAKIAEATSAAAEAAVAKVTEIHKSDTEALKGQITELNQSLDVQAKARRSDAVKIQKKNNELQFDSLLAAGSVLPAQKEEVLSLCDILDGVTEMGRGQDMSDILEAVEGNKDTMEFSLDFKVEDKSETVSATPKDLFLRLLSTIKQVDLSVKTEDQIEDDKKAAAKKIDDVTGTKTDGEKIAELTEKLKSENPEMSYLEIMDKAVDQVLGSDAAEKLNQVTM